VSCFAYDVTMSTTNTAMHHCHRYGMLYVFVLIDKPLFGYVHSQMSVTAVLLVVLLYS